MLYRFIMLFVLCCSLSLAGCALISPHYASSSGDGAPDFNVDVSQIPDAIPRHEVKQPSRRYTVHGKTYHVMKNAKNYREQGVASWYGTRFYKGKTSSGEPYNMLAMTAAHKTLPIPSYVRVTNLKNQRQVVVKVNDRGPFKPGRVIDLSYVAAKKLGITHSGTAPVEVALVEPSQPPGGIHHQKSKPIHPTKHHKVSVSSKSRKLHKLHKPKAVHLKHKVSHKVKPTSHKLASHRHKSLSSKSR